VAPGHEYALPAGNPNVLAMLACLPLGVTRFATFLSLERSSLVMVASFFY
jgi:hypothetical protein